MPASVLHRLIAPTAALAALLALTIPAPAASAEGGAEIVVGNATVAVGESSAVTVRVTGLPSNATLNGFDITLSFDGDVIAAGSVTGAGTWDTSLVSPVIDNTGGTVKVVGISLSPDCESACDLFSVTFTGVSEGQAQVSATSIQLATPGGLEIPAAATSPGTVTSGEGAPKLYRFFVPATAADGTTP